MIIHESNCFVPTTGPQSYDLARVVWVGRRRLVNILPVAQRTNTSTYFMASSKGLEPLVVSLNLREKRFRKKSGFPHLKNLRETLPGPPEIGTASW